MTAVSKEAMTAVFLFYFRMPAKTKIVAYVSICVDCLYTTEERSQKRNRQLIFYKLPVNVTMYTGKAPALLPL